MRFLILTQYFEPEVGAAQARLAAFARELVRCGHEVEIVTALPNYPTGTIFPEYRRRFLLSECDDGIVVHRCWLYASTGAGLKRMLNYGSFSATALLGMMRAARPDWVFIESPPPTLALSGLIAARLMSVPVIVNIADLWPDSIRDLGLITNRAFLKAAEWLEAFVYRHADLVNAITDGVRSRLIKAKGVPPRKITFLPNGVDTDLYCPLAPDRELIRELQLEGNAVVLYAGTHGYAHALEHAILAAQELRREAVRFVFIGDGSEKPRLVKLARDIELTNVTFLPPMPAREVNRFLSISCCGLVPQRNIPLFEGNRPAKAFSIMAAGKPVIFSGHGECARLVETANAGLVVAPEDSKALADAVRSLIGNSDAASAYGRNGRSYVQQHLQWSVVVRSWLTQLPKSTAELRRANARPVSAQP